MSFYVTAVVVSYNRAKLLNECLDAISRQTRPADRVIIIDNASTDGAYDVARNHSVGAEVVRLDHNVGGAGGFCAGIALAVAAADSGHADGHEAQSGDAQDTRHYIWLMDDDTMPTPTALEELLKATGQAAKANGAWPTVLGSQARWIDGRIHTMNRPRERSKLEGLRANTARHLHGSTNAYQVRSLSFVSCLVNATAIQHRKALPVSAYFLWNDDFEYTSRLLRDGIGYYVPQSEVVHKTRTFGSSDADPGARFRFEVRNKIWMLRFARRDFKPLEYIELVLKTIRRFTLTVIRAKDHTLICHYFNQGWHEGWRTEPPSNTTVLAGNPQVIDAINDIMH